MRILVDTPALVANVWHGHPNHHEARRRFQRAKTGADQICVSGHGTLEAYAVLTRLPIVPRFDARFVSQAIDVMLQHIEVIGVASSEYRALVDEAAAQGFTGGAIYDFLHIFAARKAGCEGIATANRSHFARLAAHTGLKIEAI